MGCAPDRVDLRGYIPILISKIESCDHLIAELSNELPRSTVYFLKTQINMDLVSKQGRRWTINEKLFAMSIFLPKQKSLSAVKNIFCLPSKRSLHRTLQNCNLCEQFYDTLKIKMQQFSEKVKTVCSFLMKWH